MLAALTTWLLPAGAFVKETVEVPGVGLRDVIVPGSYEALDEASPPDARDASNSS